MKTLFRLCIISTIFIIVSCQGDKAKDVFDKSKVNNNFNSKKSESVLNNTLDKNSTVSENSGNFLRDFFKDFLKKMKAKTDSLYLKQTEYAPGEEIKIRFEVTEKIADSAWIGIISSKVNHGSEELNKEKRLSMQTLSANTKGELMFAAPKERGKYDLRLNDPDTGLEINSITFEVK